jgi:Fe-S-cluster containining protein
MADGKPLDCGKCSAFCCKMAGHVTVSPYDIRRLARYLGLTVAEFEAKHIVARTANHHKRIKAGNETCQFLGKDHSCTVYAARPTNCRGYVCWDQIDKTVYQFAVLAQSQPPTLRRLERRSGRVYGR